MGPPACVSTPCISPRCTWHSIGRCSGELAACGHGVSSTVIRLSSTIGSKPLYVSLAQRKEIRWQQLKSQIAQRQQRVAELSDELDRWQDPAFVRIQARQRLGWVVPGETGYVVLGPDGKPIDGSNAIESQRADGEKPDADAWWARMWGSVRAADKPAPAPADATEKPKDESGKKPR